MQVSSALFVCLFIEAVVFFAYCGLSFAPRRKSIFRVGTIIVSYLFLFFTHSFSGTIGIVCNFLAFLFVNSLLIFLLYYSNVATAVIHGSLLVFISAISEMLAGNLYDYFMGSFWERWESDKELLLMSFSVLLYAVLILTFAIIQKRNRNKDMSSKREFLIAIAISLCVTVVILLFFVFQITEDLNSSQKGGLSVCMLLLFGVFLLNILLYNYMKKNSYEATVRSRQIQLEKDTHQFIDEMKERDNKQRVLLHDFKNHLSTLYSLCDGSDVARDYISKLIESVTLKSPIKYCSNDLVNAIIYRYSKRLECSDIFFNVETANVVMDFLSDFDITVILCNLLDNAVEAASVSENPFVNLSITSDVDKKISIIKISNSCSRMSEVGYLKTTKSDKDNHGLGLISVRRTLEKYGGHIQQNIVECGTMFHSIVLINWG